MKNKRMVLIVCLIVVIFIIIVLFIGFGKKYNKGKLSIWNLRNWFYNRGQNNEQRRKNSNNFKKNRIKKTKKIVDRSGFDMDVYLKEKNKERKKLLDLSGDNLFESLKNHKLEERFKVDKLCVYLFYGITGKDVKFKECINISRNFAKDMRNILSYKLFISGYNQYFFEKFLRDNWGNKSKIITRLKEGMKYDKMPECFYKFILSGQYHPCRYGKDDERQYKSTLIFLRFAIGNELDSLDNTLKNFFDSEILKKIEKRDYLEVVFSKERYDYLYYKCKFGEKCVEKIYLEKINKFLLLLKKLK